MNTRETKLVIFIISIFFVIYNFIQSYLCTGVAGDLLTFSLTASSTCYFSYKYHYKKSYKFSNILYWFMVISVPILTMIYLPKYNFKEAQNIILTEEYKYNQNVSLIHSQVRTIPVIPKINFVVDSGYKIGIQLDDTKEFYYFNPVTGEYEKLDNDW